MFQALVITCSCAVDSGFGVSSEVAVLRNLAVGQAVVVIYLPAYQHFLFS